MDIAGATALVTGANRGIGAAFLDELVARGARKVYATARDPQTLEAARRRLGGAVIPLGLDVADERSIAAAAAAAPDVTLLVSNAGITALEPLASGEPATAQALMRTNALGPLDLMRAFAPRLIARGGGIVSILSVAALLPVASAPGYSASKAAAMMFAQGLRAELGPQGVAVTLVYPGFVDTSMSAAFPFPKTPPRQIAACALDGVAVGQANVFPDPFARLVEDAIATHGDRVLMDPHGLLADLVAGFLASQRRPAAVRRQD